MVKTNSSHEISAIVHTCNSEATLARCLESIAWVDELMVVDMESNDQSLKIAEKFGAIVHSCKPVPRVDGIRNHFVGMAHGPWILVVDSDEYLPDDGEKLVRNLVIDSKGLYDAFSIPRYNYIAGQIMRGSGWYPDHQIRLFKKGAIIWKDSNHYPPHPVSDKIKVKSLSSPDCLHLHHFNYENISQFIQKQLLYALNNDYELDPDSYNFQDYLAKSYEEFSRIHDPVRDGDLSRALALIMAWDCLIQGLIHWDRLEQRPSLGEAFNLPISAVRLPVSFARKGDNLNDKLKRLERIENNFIWKSFVFLKQFLLDKVFPPNTSRRNYVSKIYKRLRQKVDHPKL